MRRSDNTCIEFSHGRATRLRLPCSCDGVVISRAVSEGTGQRARSIGRTGGEEYRKFREDGVRRVERTRTSKTSPRRNRAGPRLERTKRKGPAATQKGRAPGGRSKGTSGSRVPAYHLTDPCLQSESPARDSVARVLYITSPGDSLGYPIVILPFRNR